MAVELTLSKVLDINVSSVMILISAIAVKQSLNILILSSKLKMLSKLLEN